MRKIMLLAGLVLSLGALAQAKEGFVKYKTSMSSGTDANDMAALLGNSSLNIYFKNERSLTEMVTPLYNIRTLSDSKGTLMLMDGTGEKIFTRTSAEEAAKNKMPAKNAEPVLTITNEKKKILGYDCVKATVTSKDNTTNIILWFTDKIVCSASTGFVPEEILKKIKGLPLEMNIDKGPIKSKITASEISVKPLPDAVFILSTAGYTEKKALPRMK
jgi:GLPGLI family protein